MFTKFSVLLFIIKLIHGFQTPNQQWGEFTLKEIFNFSCAPFGLFKSSRRLVLHEISLKKLQF